jgi:hypothetical protein
MLYVFFQGSVDSKIFSPGLSAPLLSITFADNFRVRPLSVF